MFTLFMSQNTMIKNTIPDISRMIFYFHNFGPELITLHVYSVSTGTNPYTPVNWECVGNGNSYYLGFSSYEEFSKLIGEDMYFDFVPSVDVTISMVITTSLDEDEIVIDPMFCTANVENTIGISMTYAQDAEWIKVDIYNEGSEYN